MPINVTQAEIDKVIARLIEKSAETSSSAERAPLAARIEHWQAKQPTVQNLPKMSRK